jgi:hypothetical protein
VHVTAASELPVRWFVLVLLVATTLMVHRRWAAPPQRAQHVAEVDLVWTLDRMRAMAALAEYRAQRQEHERRAVWCGVRREYPRPLRSIRISKACLDNPLAKDCM